MGVSPPRHGMSLCAGAGGLDMGLQLAEPGFHTRCWVEWDDYPREAILAAQRAGYFAPAPIWTDLCTFDARPWAGRIDTLLAGYPCQPFSAAGQRKGADDERHLWPEVARVARELGPALRWIFLENVAGHVSLGLEAVLRELRSMGFTPAAGLFSASEVGATHERQRIFIVAHRDQRDDERRGIERPEWRDEPSDGSGQLADADTPDRRQDASPGCDADRDAAGWHEAHRGPRSDGAAMADSDGQGCGWEPELCRGRDADPLSPGPDPDRRGPAALENPERAGAGRGTPDPDQQGRVDLDRGRASLRRGDWTVSPDGSATNGESVGNASGIGRREGRAEPKIRGGRHAAPGAGGAMADAGRPRPQGRERDGSPDEWDRQAAHGPAAERGRPRLHPPGPADMDGWRDTLTLAPWLAPAVALRDLVHLARQGQIMVESGQMAEAAIVARLRGMADGLANRTRALRLLGNGVHPLAAGNAWRTLAAAHGLGPVDLGATAGDG
ncbi:DNA cytosine methyltransferase [Paracoccus litorisediminis]|uniref:DNA (cytosine-5-)-methyltransferase n=1 Tax=Paracoccus litorisediminis TaxID=2006130 RepID=A0A844HSK2_9RHOB|nr:hypothetical protein [Paracoccus litorisediminis]